MSSSCSCRWLLLNRKRLVWNKLLPALHLHQQGQWMRGGQVNAGLGDSHGFFFGWCPETSPAALSLEALPWEIAPGITSPLVPTWISQPSFHLHGSLTCLAWRILSYHFPVLPKVLGMEKAGRRGEFLPLRLLLGCCAQEVPRVGCFRPVQLPTLILYMHCPTCATFTHQIWDLLCPIPLAAHSLLKGRIRAAPRSRYC